LNANKVWLVFRKDWREIRRNRQVLTPILVIPILVSVLLPVVIVSIPNFSPSTTFSTGNLANFLTNLPPSIINEITGMTVQQSTIYLLVLYFLAPIFLIVPIMASSVIASDSFAGEKERKTIEALLATPLTDAELFLGKILVAFIPAIIITFASFAIYSVVVDSLTAEMFNGLTLLPNQIWLTIIFGLSPAIALTSIGLTVTISAKVKGFREAQQISVILVAPILGLVFGQISGALFLGETVLYTLIAIFTLIDIIVFYIGIKLFKREEILSKPA
jgi:ABC-2 type transport system permease protein